MQGSYETAKVVRMRSWKLYLLKTLFVVFIAGYVLGYQCWYQGRHFLSSPLIGFARLDLQEPTKHHCNPMLRHCDADFTPIAHLSYCRVHDEVRVHDDVHPSCRYADSFSLGASGEHTFMIPTYQSRRHQSKNLNCNNPSASDCRNEYEFTGHDEDWFVADIERFTVLLQHAFTLPGELRKAAQMSGGSTSSAAGKLEVCNDTDVRADCEEECVFCLFGSCECDGKVAEMEEAFSIRIGDVITVASLLKLAGVDLDKDVSHRRGGVVLQLEIDYSNRKAFNWPPWQPGALQYVYRVSRVPFESIHRQSVTYYSHGKTRSVEKAHGIFILTRLTGSVHYFSWSQLLLILTTSVGLLAAADAAVHYSVPILHSSAFAADYKRHKYEEASDLSRYDADLALLNTVASSQASVE
eukprot:TRINITY_DN26067_c0_g1_i1.p1 TRINITY_DN26067_c0_g1~~TRINITY_DN26067_c0_g1_i1.p1  ORF type:complete len:410 (+),score=41.90 TRINITY_DN26067_c0_g1_i1:197-1426(+)